MSSKAWRNRRPGEYSHYRRVLRPMVMERDGGMCKLAFSGTWNVVVRKPDGTRVTEVRKCTGIATQVHHTRGKAVTGDDIRYMVAACRACNLKAGDPTKDPNPKPRPCSLL